MSVFNNYLGFIVTIGIILTLIVFWLAVRRISNVLIRKFESDAIVQNIKINYSEDTIIGHLDYIINETIEEYIIYNIRPKNIYYINTSMENEMRDKVSEKVAEKISITLKNSLSLIYDPGYVGKAIGNRIYMKILDYVVGFNVNASGETKNKNK